MTLDLFPFLLLPGVEVPEKCSSAFSGTQAKTVGKKSRIKSQDEVLEKDLITGHITITEAFT